jgi:bifunctional DNase/RNase
MTDTGTGSGTEDAPAGLDPGTWRLAVVAGVRMDMPGEYPEVLVHEAVAPWRELAIPVGMAEGNAIAYAWRGLTTARPLTHALFTDVLERHGVELEAVRITARRGRNFFAELDTVGPRGRQVISCRPSDALALVLRQRMPTPVLVADSVFDPPDTGSTAADDDAALTATAASPPLPPSTAGTPVSETPSPSSAPESPPPGTVDTDAGADVTTPG